MIYLMAAAFGLGVPLIMALVAWASERPVKADPRVVRRDSRLGAMVAVGLLWALLTVAGEIFALRADYFPLVQSDKGEEIEEAFRVLMVLSVPVFTGVLAMLIYGVARRGFADLPPDGPAYHGRGPAPIAWFAATAGLTALVIVYPGLTSLHLVTEHVEHPDLLVEVEGMQWTWLVSYPQLGVADVRELRLPVDRTVRFEITSRDVLHSFWVPSFLMKIDAVPGKTTRISLRPTKLGSIDTDPTVRLQCAELCGLSHATMQIPVSVVSGRDFDAWIRERAAQLAGPATRREGGAEVTLVAEGARFDTAQIEVAAGELVTYVLDNRDAGVRHSLSVYASEPAAKGGAMPLFASRRLPGRAMEKVEFSMTRPGSYFFRCEVHPELMSGRLVAQ